MPTPASDSRVRRERGLKNWQFYLAFAAVIVAVAAAVPSDFRRQLSGVVQPEGHHLPLGLSILYCLGLLLLFACGYTDMSIGGVVVLGSFAPASSETGTACRASFGRTVCGTLPDLHQFSDLYLFRHTVLDRGNQPCHDL
jgi:hypothetical protein